MKDPWIILKSEMYKCAIKAINDACETKATRLERKWLAEKCADDILEKVKFLWKFKSTQPPPILPEEPKEPA